MKMSDDDLKEKVKILIVEEFGLDENLAYDAALFSSDLLDSLNSLEVIALVETQLGVQISPLDVSLDDFDSVDRIAATIIRLR